MSNDKQFPPRGYVVFNCEQGITKSGRFLWKFPEPFAPQQGVMTYYSYEEVAALRAEDAKLKDYKIDEWQRTFKEAYDRATNAEAKNAELLKRAEAAEAVLKRIADHPLKWPTNDEKELVFIAKSFFEGKGGDRE